MLENIVNACNSLDALADSVRDSWTDDRTMQEAFGWNFPAVSRHDIADQIRKLADRMREISPAMIDTELDQKISLLPSRMASLQSNTVPQLYNGNGQHAFPALISTLEWAHSLVAPLLMPEVDWNDVEEQNLMPRALLRRLKSVDTQVNSVITKSSDLSDKIDRINDAHTAAELLPTELEQLREVAKSANADHKAIGLILTSCESHKSILENLENEAKVLVEKCGQYSSAMTTVGLGSAFEKRASALNSSMWIWVGGLLASLALGACLAHERIETLNALLVNPAVSLNQLWANVVVTIFSVAAPVWFAWVATKQIGQRFRLSEDYAFKSSVAQAYEGYRREAANYDGSFTARLFGLALTRLEQEPLRYVENENHGSPFHEMLRAAFFRKPKVGREIETAD
jgi:hypothetical protein